MLGSVQVFTAWLVQFKAYNNQGTSLCSHQSLVGIFIGGDSTLKVTKYLETRVNLALLTWIDVDKQGRVAVLDHIQVVGDAV